LASLELVAAAVRVSPGQWTGCGCDPLLTKPSKGLAGGGQVISFGRPGCGHHQPQCPDRGLSVDVQGACPVSHARRQYALPRRAAKAGMSSAPNMFDEMTVPPFQYPI
jgi:hypothetical protein